MSGGSGSRSQHPYARFAPPSTSSSLSSTSSSSSSSSWGRPSFSSATSNSLPGALGISHGQQEQHQHQSQPQTIPFGLPSASEISRSRSPSSNHHAARGNHAGSTAIGGPAFYTLASDSSSSSLHSRPSYGGAPTSGIGGPASGSGAGAMGIAGTSSSRDFLVPIGSTGARQKLSILSPSQRRAAAGSSGSGESQYTSPLRGAGAPTAATPTAAAAPMGANNGTMSASSSASSLSSSSPFSVRQSMQSSSRQSPQTSLEERAPSSGKASAGNGYHSGDSSNVTPPRPARSGQRHGSGPVSSPSPSSSQSHARADANANSRHALVYSPPRSGSPSRSPPSTSYSSGSSAATTRTPGTSPAPHPYAPASRPRPSLPEDQRSRSERDSKSDADFFGGGGSSTRSRPSRSSQGGSESATSTPPARNRSVTPTQDSTTAAAGGQRLRSADLAAALRGDTQSSPYKASSTMRPTSSDGVAQAGAGARGSAQPSSYGGASYGSADTPATSSRKGDSSVGSPAGSISSSSGIKGRLNKMLGTGKSGAKPAKEGAVATDYGSEPKQYSSNDSLRGSGMGMRKTESSSSIKSSTSQSRMGTTAAGAATSPGPAILPTSASSGSVGYGSAPGTASAAGSPAIPWRGNRSRSNTASSSAAASTYSDRDRDRGPTSSTGASADSPRKAQHPRHGGLPTEADTASSRADQAAAAAAAGPDSIDQRDTRSSDVAPELNLKSSDFGDLQSMMPASYMGAGSRSAGGESEGNGLLAASPGAAVLLDKSLPPTPEPEDSPRSRSQVAQQQANAAAAAANASSSSTTADAERRPSATPSTLSRSGSAGIISGAGVPNASASESATNQREEAEAARNYIPPGALSFNRKGVAVRDRLVNGGAGGLGVPEGVNQSRFSTSTNDVDSVKSPSPGTLNNNIPATPGTRLSLHSLENGNEDDVDASRAASEDRGSLLPASAWAEVEVALLRFKDASSSPTASAAMDKGALIRNVLLPFLALEAETPNLEVLDGKFRSPKARRALFFDWIANLLIELQRVQTSADRGAILESIACIIESRNLSPQALRDDAKDEAKFGSTFGHILLYAIGELNKKGVYQNTLIFSGRLLAVAFFRVAGVASKLLRALPINRFALERVAAEAGWEAVVPTPFHLFAESFPETLRDYCFYDARTYLKVLDAQTSTSNGDRARNGDDDNDEDEDDDDDDDRFLVRQPEVQVEMTGNWLRRWQSDDSELFFSFCRSYHRQLAGLLTSTPRLRKVSPLFFGGPGYAHLATCIHLKCLSLVNRDILSVTTLSSQKTFNPGETANVLSGSTAGKPRHLEAANRRCTAIIVDLVRAPSGGNHVFVPMLGVHIKCLVKRTSLYDVQGVFCLLDWLDGVLGHMDAAELSIEGLVDIDFLITTLGLLLEKADHALALMRAIAFSYSNFAVLISTQEHRRRFCQEMLLKPAIFQKLFLSWSFTIRAYFLHLLVFRLARIGDFPQAQGDATGKTAVEIARVFNARLDEIRKRHEELSPTTPGAEGDSDEEDGDEGDAKSTTSRRPPSFVSTIRRTPSIVNVDASSAGHGGGHGGLNNTEGRAPGTGAPNTMTKAERVLGIGVPDPVLSGKQRSASGGRRFTSVLNDDDGMGGGGAGGGGGKSQSRAAKWLRALGGKKKGGAGGSNSNFSSPSTDSTSSFGGGASYDSPQISNRPRFKQMASLSELDFSDDDEDEDENGEDGEEDGYDSPDAGYDATSGTANNNGGGGTNAVLDPSASASGSAGIDPTLHGDNIAMDTTFDLQSAANSVPPREVGAGSVGGANSSGPGGPASSPPRMPRAFSKRTSILPGPAYDLVENGGPSSSNGGGGTSPIATTKAALVRNGYPESQHVYATQGLREWEAVLAEHDEFFATMADGSGPPAVPRLPVQWPAMWSD